VVISIQYPLLILLSSSSPHVPHRARTHLSIGTARTPPDRMQAHPGRVSDGGEGDVPNGYTTLKSHTSPITYFMHGKTGETLKYDLIIECN